MKKLLTIVLALALLSSLAACGGKQADTAPPPADPGTSAPADTGGDTGGYTGGEYKFVTSSHIAKEELATVYMDHFCDLVEERTGGKITFDRFYSGQIANQAESAEGLKVGSIDIAVNDWPSMSSVNGFAKGDIMALGYLFNSFDHVKAFAASDDYKQMCDELVDQVGIRCLAVGASGFRQVATKNAPITSIDDFQGLRIRVPDIAIYVNTFQALGCATTIVANSEVYTALQTGMVDSVENPVQGMYNMSWYEQLDYINETNHIFCDIDLFMNEERFQSLDAQAQAVLLECAQEASAANLELTESKNDEYVALCEEAGTQYNTFDTAPIVDVMKNEVWPAYFAAVDGGEELVNRVLALG
ncbi:TRAP transporter substrate-binding protein [uncultured Oscillibacter sp.]|uniref:TRAP transporter substrate-binding protein n=1 Tax=uncultured Oscillibacter sp. TaxID=876091 RepID=UPI0025F3A02C|nr:TRAP transporter substrate-binding protein [uncultured Oscillibacter sp.]